MSKEDLLSSVSKMIVNGNRLELPTDEQFTNYPQVKKCLLDAGGKYKKCGFEFSGDASEVKARLLGGEAINDKKKYQCFFSPPNVAKRVVDLAGIEMTDRWLEPSAGQGSLANLAMKESGNGFVVELMPENCLALARQGYSVSEYDFLLLTPGDIGKFDKIIANPPFTRNQDIDHIRHMYAFLKPGGRLVSVASKSWTFGSPKKQAEFRDWLEVLGATVHELPAGEFKESGTNISSVIIEIQKEVQNG